MVFESCSRGRNKNRGAIHMKLYVNGIEAKKSQEVTDFRGDKAILKDWREPHKSASGGHVTLKYDKCDEMEYYASVINGKFFEPKTVMAMIHSLKSTAEVKIISENDCNNVVAEYQGKQYTAIYNGFVGLYYVDNIYGEIL
jgi:hypothetical protein